MKIAIANEGKGRLHLDPQHLRRRPRVVHADVPGRVGVNLRGRQDHRRRPFPLPIGLLPKAANALVTGPYQASQFSRLT
jgi:hypothetical protein